MSKGGGNNSEAIKLQKQSLEDQRVSSRRIEQTMKQSAKAAEAQVLPKFESPAPQAMQTLADLEATANETRVRSMRKQGLNNTTFAGAR